jgi:hypothetical protein
MGPVIIFLGVPLLIFLALVVLPPGWPALAGVGAAAVAVALGVPRLLPEDGAGFGTMLLWLYGGAVALAALAQGLRLLRRRGGAAASYPLIAGLCLLGAVVPLAMILGVF